MEWAYRPRKRYSMHSLLNGIGYRPPQRYVIARLFADMSYPLYNSENLSGKQETDLKTGLQVSDLYRLYIYQSVVQPTEHIWYRGHVIEKCDQKSQVRSRKSSILQLKTART